MRLGGSGVNPRLSAILLALLLGLPLQATSAVVSISQGPYNVGIGFGPSDVSPLSQGIPIFTQGDQLWVENYYNFSVVASLVQPNGTSVPPQWLPVEEPALLRSFSEGDGVGTWELKFTDTFGGSFSIPIELVGHNQSLDLSLASVGFGAGGVLSLGFSVGRSEAYQIQACAVGADTPTTVSLGVPSGLGGGLVNLRRDGANTTVSFTANATQDFTFSFEMYHSYSYRVGSQGEVTSRLLEVESIDPLSFGPNSTTTTFSSPMRYQLPERDGRYILRALFRSSLGISAQETNVLVTSDGGWVSLAGCSASTTATGQDFTLSSALSLSTADWPRGAFAMYTVGGIDNYGFMPIDPGLSAVSVVGTPWNVSLTDVDLRAAGPSVQDSAAVNGTVYILALSYPASGSIQMSVGGRVYQAESFNVAKAYSVTTAEAEVAKLDVTATSDGEPLAGATVSVTGSANPGRSKPANSSGDAVFFLPAGAYSIAVSSGGVSRSATVNLTSGQAALVNVDLGSGTALFPLYALAALGVVGVVGNVWVWRSYFGRRIRVDESGHGKQA